MIYKSRIDVTAKPLVSNDSRELKTVKNGSIVNVERMAGGAVQFKTEDDKLFQLPLNEFLFAFIEMEMVDVQEEYIDNGCLSSRIIEELREVTK